MAKIKIISNPYQKIIAFQSWSDLDQAWKDIDRFNNPNSDLLKEKYMRGFFPFRVKDIVDEIIKEYHEVEIIFEGTGDEYKELQELCMDERYTNIVTLKKSELILENARDIFPDINEVFDKNLRPLIIQNGNIYEKIRNELEKYSDVTNDVIPICVLGNYSAGKSSFINALIGSEILPSGAEPVTAKIYKIKQSEYPDRASVTLKFDNQDVRLKFDNGSFRLNTASGENELTRRLADELNLLETATITMFVNKALEIINNLDAVSDMPKISDTIEIEIPFVGGIWGEIKRQFVIFDTPGSNSASNKSHAELLKEALGGFSNGLPLYLSELDKLDSTDNENLYKEIEKLEELDDRFTMVIVNKADAAELDKGGFSKEKEMRILGETIPKNLYKGGIYFVSSVVGLGSKSKGEFIDDHYAELFDEKQAKFSDENSRFYKTLYKYNIMPEQLKKKSVAAAEKIDGKLWANSGLFTVEKEIQTFAVKYSAYNKCQQAKLFLDKIITTTSSEIETIKSERQELRGRLDEKLHIDEKELIDKIENASETSRIKYESAYQEFMRSCNQQIDFKFTQDDLKRQEAEIEKDKQADHLLAERESDASDSVDELVDDLAEGIMEVFSKPDLDGFRKIGEGFLENVNQIFESYGVLNDTKKQVDQATAAELLNKVTKEFNNRFETAQSMLEEQSRHYWTEKTQAFKNVLIEIVAGTSVLSEDKRMELEKIIIAYGDILFAHHAEEIFLEKNFKRGIKIGGLVLFESDKLDIGRLTERYNKEMNQNIEAVGKAIQDGHTESFSKWKENLVGTVTSKIVEYSPLLHSQAQIIFEETEKIMELENRQKQLANYAEVIRKMMDWKIA